LRVLRVGSYVALYRPAEQGICVVRVFEGHREYPVLFAAE
jgi:plasmid stabilization system protein ParE